MKLEEWRSVVGFEGRYEVSNLGRVKSLPNTRRKTELVLSLSVMQRGGYLIVNLTDRVAGRWRQRVRPVHTLVAAAFLGSRPLGMEICHNDGDPTNAAESNLRYDTPVANQADRLAHGSSNRGESNGVAVLTEERVIDMKRRLSTASIAQVARDLEINYSTVRNVANGNNWGWVK